MRSFKKIYLRNVVMGLSCSVFLFGIQILTNSRAWFWVAAAGICILFLRTGRSV